MVPAIVDVFHLQIFCIELYREHWSLKQKYNHGQIISFTKKGRLNIEIDALKRIIKFTLHYDRIQITF